MKDPKGIKLFDEIVKNEEVFLSYLKSRFPMFHKSNFFFRDLEYGIKTFYDKKNVFISISDSLTLAVKLGSYFEEKGYFKKVSDGVWMVNIPEYMTSKPGDPF